MTVYYYVTKPRLEAAQFKVIIKFYDAASQPASQREPASNIAAIAKLLLKLPARPSNANSWRGLNYKTESRLSCQEKREEMRLISGMLTQIIDMQAGSGN